jgi:uncharacterized damage-inducible protein DinB
MNSVDQLRYPIGKFSARDSYTLEEVASFIKRIEDVPARIETIVQKLSAAQLDTPYREGGWTARQVLHHLPDSHLNAYIRIKWALTEDTPTIKAYDEKAWAETPETTSDPALSLAVLKALHAKWAVLLRGLTARDLEKRFYHPDSKKHVRIDQAIATYAWHGEHHIGHVNIVAEK